MFFKRLFSIFSPETLYSTSTWNIKYTVTAFAAGGGVCVCVVVGVFLISLVTAENTSEKKLLHSLSFHYTKFQRLLLGLCFFARKG